MIYGVNFNGEQIPDGIRKKFAQALDSKFRRVGANRGCAWRLVGAATSEEEKDAMIVQATTGHRKLHTVKRTIHGLVYFGIYSGF